MAFLSTSYGSCIAPRERVARLKVCGRGKHPSLPLPPPRLRDYIGSTSKRLHRHPATPSFARPFTDPGKAVRMAASTPGRLLLIVVGSTLRAEEVDRPLAYFLKQKVEQYLDEHVPESG